MKLMDLFQCAVCLSDMEKSPRTLNCLHTFCTECLTQLIHNNRIQCPTCREVTELKTNNVNELKIDFRLRQMQDQMRAETPRPSASPEWPTSMCQVCQQTQAVSKCEVCPKLLCEGCKQRHGEIQEFQQHAVFDLCQKHQEGITHLCTECVYPLCMRCMLLDHKQHKDHLIGIKQLQEKAQTIQQNINQKMSTIRENVKKNEEKHGLVLKFKQSLEEQKKLYKNKIEEAEKHQKETESEVESYREIQKEQEEEIQECNIAAASLTGLMTGTAGFCEKYQKLMQNAEQVLEKKTPAEYTLPLFVLAEPGSGKMVEEIKTNKIKNLKMVKTILTIDKSDQINCAYDITFIGDDVLFPTFDKPHHLIHLNVKGEVVARYYPPHTENMIYGAAVYDNKIYITQAKALTVISPLHKNKTEIYKPKINHMCRFVPQDKSTLFICDYGAGKIYKYDVKRDQTEELVQGLKKPSFIKRMKTREGNRYIVTEEFGHSMKVYDDSWQLVNSFGCAGSGDSQFDMPDGIAVTDMGTILIADRLNNRISHYTPDGTLLSHVVTKDHGLGYPIAIAYKPPYLWSSTYYGTWLKCFEITTIET